MTEKDPPRRVLSLWQPWAMFAVTPLPSNRSLTARPAGKPLKEFETRHWEPGAYTRQTPIPIAIHATKKFDQKFLNGRVKHLWAALDFPSIEVGKIIGAGFVTRIIETSNPPGHWRPDTIELQLGDWSAGRYAWLLRGIRPLPDPIPFKGRQTPLYELDPAIDAEIDRQVGPVTDAELILELGR